MVVNAYSYSLFNSSYSTASGSNKQPAISIRSARLEDVKSVASILTDSFHPPRGLMFWMHPLLKLGVCEDLRGRLRSNLSNYNCLVASACIANSQVEENLIVGTVELSIRSSYSSFSNLVSSYPYIANLAVDCAYRRQGVARKLLVKCEEIARKWGFKELSLHVLDNNERAKKLYLSIGYELIKVESGFGSCIFNTPKRLLLSKKIKH